MYNRKIPVDSVETDVLLIRLAVDNALKPNENIGDSDDNRFSLDTLEAASSALERGLQKATPANKILGFTLFG